MTTSMVVSTGRSTASRGRKSNIVALRSAVDDADERALAEQRAALDDHALARAGARTRSRPGRALQADLHGRRDRAVRRSPTTQTAPSRTAVRGTCTAFSRVPPPRSPRWRACPGSARPRAGSRPRPRPGASRDRPAARCAARAPATRRRARGRAALADLGGLAALTPQVDDQLRQVGHAHQRVARARDHARPRDAPPSPCRQRAREREHVARRGHVGVASSSCVSACSHSWSLIAPASCSGRSRSTVRCACRAPPPPAARARPWPRPPAHQHLAAAHALPDRHGPRDLVAGARAHHAPPARPETCR
jgi:hypothetical protein